MQYQKVYQPFEYIHFDVFGPVPVNKPYPHSFVAFTDEATRFRWVFPLTDKSADTMLHIITSLIHMIQRQFKANVLCFQCDHGREYDNKLIQNYLQEKGIQCIFNSVADSASNGVSERANLTLLNDCRTLLTSSALPEYIWFYAIQFSTIIRNTVFNSVIQNSPRAQAGLPGLNVKTILPFGQPVIVHLTKTSSKLHFQGEPGIALTPSDQSYGYLIFITSSRKIVDTANYAVVKQNKTIDAATEYYTSILDPFFNTFNDHVTEIENMDDSTNNLTPATGTFTTDTSNTSDISDTTAKDIDSDPEYLPPDDNETDTDIEFSSDDDDDAEFIEQFLHENPQEQAHQEGTENQQQTHQNQLENTNSHEHHSSSHTEQPISLATGGINTESTIKPTTTDKSQITTLPKRIPPGKLTKNTFYGTSTSDNTSLGGNTIQQRKLRARIRDKTNFGKTIKTGIDANGKSLRYTRKKSPDYNKAVKHSLNYVK